MKSVSESLAGRADIVELETLSLTEIRAALPQTVLESTIVQGGFPELYANQDIDIVAFYNSYQATYPERDVQSPANGRSGKHSSSPNCELASAVPDGRVACSFDGTAHAKWTSLEKDITIHSPTTPWLSCQLSLCYGFGTSAEKSPSFLG